MPTVQRHGGDVFKTTGDGFLAAFGSVGEALEAAVGDPGGVREPALCSCASASISATSSRSDGDMFGDGVNIAARLEGHGRARRHLRERAVVRSVGKTARHPFRPARAAGAAKNMPEPIEVYAARWGAAAARHLWPRWRQPLLAAAAAVADRRGGGHGLDLPRTPGYPLSRARAGCASAIRYASKRTRTRPAVAVLPFDNLSGDPAQDYFSDGLTEDIITDLARNGELLVIARNSTFAFKDNPTRHAHRRRRARRRLCGRGQCAPAPATSCGSWPS